MEELFEIKSRYGKFDDYRIGKSGIVYSLRQGGVIKPLASTSLDTSGYPMVFLLDKNGKKHTIKTHTIVADTFIPNPNNLPCINHKDEDKTNNNVENLEWCTKSYNNTYNDKAKKIGIKLRDSNPRKKRVASIDKNGNIVAIYKSVREAARAMGNADFDSNIHSGIRNHQTRYGFYWAFIDNCDNPISRDNQQPSSDLKGQKRFRDYELKLFKFTVVSE